MSATPERALDAAGCTDLRLPPACDGLPLLATLAPLSLQRYAGILLNTCEWQLVDNRSTRVVRQRFSANGAESDFPRRPAEQDLDTSAAKGVCLVESVRRGLASGSQRPGPSLSIPPEV